MRQVLSLAVDRSELIRELRGFASPLNQLVHRGIFGYVSDLPDLPHDPGEARRLLASAGYPEGFDTTLVHRDDAGLENVAESLRRRLGEVGIRVEVKPMAWEVILNEAWLSRRVPVFLAGWQFDETDAWGFLRDCIYTQDETRTYGAYNPGYSNSQMDRLIDEGDLIFDQPERLAHYQTIVRLALEDMPLVPLYARQDIYAVSEQVRWQPRLDGSLHAVEMSWIH